MTVPVIRPVEDRDIAALVALWHAAGVARPWNDPATDIAFARRGPQSTILVAARGEDILASAMVGNDGHRGWIYYLAADPRHHGEGLGRAMMAAAEDWLGRRGIWKVQLLIRADNQKVKAFYEHIGYHDTGTSCYQKVLASLS